MYYISMDVRSSAVDNTYEIVSHDELEYDDSSDPAILNSGAGNNAAGSIAKAKPGLSAPKKGSTGENLNLVADKELDNPDLASNLASNSKGELGLGVNQAPKGGIANEAPIVGSDEDQIIGTGKGSKFKKKIDVDPTGKKSKEDGTVGDADIENSIPNKNSGKKDISADINGKVQVDVDPSLLQRTKKKTGYKASKNGENPEEDDTPKNSFQAQKKQQMEELKQKQELENPEEEVNIKEDKVAEQEESKPGHKAVSNEPPSIDNA